MSDPIVLNYAGAAGVNDMGAFNARLNIMWKGDNLFRIYPADGQLYFIRVGGSKRNNAVVGRQFGLIGILIAHFANKRAAKKTAETLNQIAGVPPQELLNSHKLNFTIPISQVASAVINPGSFWSGTNIGRLQIVDMTGKKRALTFDDVDSMRSAVQTLPTVLDKRLTINVEWNEQKQKFKKKKN